MKAQVLTTTRSASSGEAAASKPSTVRVPTNLSESTWFFGQPNVSIQYRSATAPMYRGTGLLAPRPLRVADPAPDAARAPRDRRARGRPRGEGGVCAQDIGNGSLKI